jgi:hypothetical protein
MLLLGVDVQYFTPLIKMSVLILLASSSYASGSRCTGSLPHSLLSSLAASSLRLGLIPSSRLEQMTQKLLHLLMYSASQILSRRRKTLNPSAGKYAGDE